MIYDDPSFFDPYLRARFEQLRRFLRARGAPEAAYRLAPISRDPREDADVHALLTAIYAPERYRNGAELALLSWPTPSGRAQVRTDLLQAGFVIAFAFDRPENIRLLTDLPADMDSVLAAEALGIDRAVLKPGVAQYAPGSYVAHERDVWTYFLVEPYGEIVLLADSSQAAPVLQMYASDKLQEEQNLAGRMAEFMTSITIDDASQSPRPT